MTVRWVVKAALLGTLAVWVSTWALVEFSIWFEPYAEKIAAKVYQEEDGTWR